MLEHNKLLCTCTKLQLHTSMHFSPPFKCATRAWTCSVRKLMHQLNTKCPWHFQTPLTLAIFNAIPHHFLEFSKHNVMEAFARPDLLGSLSLIKHLKFNTHSNFYKCIEFIIYGNSYSLRSLSATLRGIAWISENRMPIFVNFLSKELNKLFAKHQRKLAVQCLL